MADGYLSHLTFSYSDFLKTRLPPEEDTRLSQLVQY